MSRATQLRAIPWVLGVLLLVACAAGAKSLINSSESMGGAPVAAGPPPTLPGGVLVLGTADSDPPPVQVGPPALAALAAVVEVKVKEGQEVKPGDALVQFDDRIPQAKKKEAEAELAAAEQDAAKAAIQKEIHVITLSRQELAVKSARQDRDEAENAYKIARDLFDKTLNAERDFNTSAPLTESQKDERRRQNLDLRKAALMATQAQNKFADEEKKLEAAKLMPVEADAKQAAAKVDRLRATVEEAAAAVEECVVRARVAGVVEQVVVTPGVTIGPATRAPLMWLIPTGGRVVRAEVEAEFASKIADKVGKKVTVYDHGNTSVSYDGVVRRIGTGFLPRRNAGDTLGVNQTRILECLVDVPDPAPTGKPPLRVGQPVRVSFPEK